MRVSMKDEEKHHMTSLCMKINNNKKKKIENTALVSDNLEHVPQAENSVLECQSTLICPSV